MSSTPRHGSRTREHLGVAAVPFRATLFDKSGASNWLIAWHQDTALPLQREVEADGRGPWSCKGGVRHAIAPASALGQVVAFRMHLDESTTEKEPLRVLPGSHALGGVVAMRPLTAHASSTSRSDQPRRVLHIEYAATLHFEHGIALAVG